MRFVLYDQKTSYRFDVVSDADQIVFESGDYDSQQAATDAIGDVIDALRDRSRYQTAGGGGVTLTDGSGRELVKGRVPDGVGAEAFIDQRVGDASDQDRFEVEVNATGMRFGEGGMPKAPSRDEMASHYDYSVRSGEGGDGVYPVGSAAPYRFVYQDGGGRGILYSRDFPNVSRQRSGIRSLLRYAKERYVERWEEGGKYYFRVLSPQGFELARSPGFGSEAERKSAVTYYLGSAEKYKSAFAKPTKGQRLRAQEYEFDRQSETRKEGFEEYQSEANKRQYFTFNDTSGRPLLFSQAYRGSKARETGLKSVVKNGVREDRYRIRERGGKYYIVLLAGNNQEIGRSRAFDSESAAEGQRDYLVGAMKSRASKFGVDLAAASAAAAAAATTGLAARRTTSQFEITRATPPPPPPPPAPAPEPEPTPELEPVAAAPEPVAEPEPIAEPAPAYVPNAAREQDNYLVCSAYQDRADAGDSKHARFDDVIAFQHDNGLHYFATLDADGKVALRSEGYPTVGARDNGLKSVLRFREKRGRFGKEEVRGMHFTYVTAQNGQEIARSCPKRSDDEASALWPALGAAALGAAAARAATPEPEPVAAPEPEPVVEEPPAPVAVAPEPEPEPEPEEPKDKEDDYLACKEYRGRKINDKVNRVSLFKHKNGQFYFAILTGDDNRVRLRSEGFATAKERDKELSGALRNLDNEERYERITHGDYHINVLYDDDGREVGRSCAEKEPAPFIPLVAAGGLGVAGAMAATAAVPAVKATPPPPPPPPPTPTPPPPPPPVKPAPVAPPPAAPADKGGCAWWMWLLAALLLLGLLWYFLRGCNDAPPAATVDPEVPAAVTTPAPEPTPAPAVVATPEPEPEPVVAPDPVAAPPPPPPAPRAAQAAGDGLECGSIAASADYNDLGIPELPVQDFGGLAGDVQDYLRSGDGGARTFSMSNVAFLAPGNDLAIEPCSVGDVDRLAAVLRDNPGARLTISVPSERNCRTLARLLRYRGVDRSRIEIQPSGANEIVVTP